MSNSLPKETLEVLSEITDPPTPNDKVTIVLKPLGTNKTIAFVDGEDFNDHTLKVVKSYAVGIIKEKKSKYQIDSNINANNMPLNTPEGNPVPISDGAPGGDSEKTFLGSRNVSSGRSYFYSLSEPGIYNTNSKYSNPNGRNDEGIKVIKGKTTPEKNEIDFIYEFDQIPPKVGQTLINNNSNYPETNGTENLYVTLGQQETQSNVNRRKIQSTLGSYKRTLSRNEQDVGNDGHTGETTLIQQDFLNMGLQLTLKGSGELYVPKFGPNQTDETPAGQILAARAGALVPGAARLGLRIPVRDMTPTEVLDNNFNGVLKQDKKLNKTSNFPDLASEPINSYGSYNNWIVPFDSIEGFTQMPALAIMIGAISLIVVAIAEILNLSEGKDTYADQVRAGFIIFFGLNSPGGRYDPLSFTIAVATAIASERMFKETGWYGTVVRSFIKNLFQEISRGSFAIAVTANVNGETSIANRTGVDIYSDGIDGDIVGAASKIIELFSNSKLVRFVKMLAEIGEDVVIPTINPENKPVLIRPLKKGLSSAKNARAALTANQKSFIDEFIDGTTAAYLETSLVPILKRTGKLNSFIFKSRLQSNRTKGAIGVRPLAWGTDTTPSMFLLPNSIKKAAYAVKGQDGLNKLNDYLALEAMDSISTEQIGEFEQKLESSYMPFSFQDMRTGEILSFHAFIENMQDQFQADYETETGFGRVEPTHTYKNTNRSMSIEFWVVATNPSDHDVMWLKINKLLTLLYPQYTAGRALTVQTAGSTSQTQKFIQPYSQLVGAAPLIRLRVGDVWKSNYNKFNVMRLFGLGKGEFNLDETSFNQLNQTAQITENITYNETLERMLTGDLRNGEQIIISYSKAIDNRIFGIGDALGTARELKVPDLEPGLYTFRVDDPGNILQGINNSIRPYRQYNLRLVTADGGVATGTESNAATYVLRYANLNVLQNPEHVGILDTWDINVAYSSLSLMMTVDFEWLKTKTGYRVTGVDQNNSDQIKQKIAEFFNTTEDGANPIMQSFENNKGKGIAGFITRLDFDWRESTWETEHSAQRNSSRAPMMCKISLQFLPIHDIVPGIDSDGFMTAPIYPVGRFANVTNDIYPDTVSPAGAPSDGTSTGASDTSGGGTGGL